MAKQMKLNAEEGQDAELLEPKAARAVLEDLEALRKQLEEAERQRDEYLAILQRTRADFENYQKRIHRDVAEQERYFHGAFAEQLLPVVDNLQRALDAARHAGEKGSLVQGVTLVQSQMLDTFRRFGITAIEAEGQPFDPMLHDAVVQEFRTDVAPGTVVRVLEPGYRIHERVLRPAKVAVSAAPTGEHAEPDAIRRAPDKVATESRNHTTRYPASQRILNRLLAIEEFSLANYLMFAPPWAPREEGALLDAIRRIAKEEQDEAIRIGEFLISRYGYVEPGRFPPQFAAYNDLALDYLTQRLLIEHKRQMIDEIAQCVKQLAGDPEAKQLAEEVLAGEYRHLDLLSRLELPGARGKPSRAPDRPAA